MDSKTIAPNPYDYINEVRNSALFAGRREELAQLEEEVAALAAAQGIPPMVAIVGERRIGQDERITQGTGNLRKISSSSTEGLSHRRNRR